MYKKSNLLNLQSVALLADPALKLCLRQIVASETNLDKNSGLQSDQEYSYLWSHFAVYVGPVYRRMQSE